MFDLGKLAGNLAKFLGHYSGELAAISGSLDTIVDHMPLDHQDKARVKDTITGLTEAAARVAEGAAAMANVPVQEVTISKADVEAAVAAFITAHPEVIREALGNGNG